MAEATWPLRQRLQTRDRRARDSSAARGEVGWYLWACSVRLSSLMGVGYALSPSLGDVVQISLPVELLRRLGNMPFDGLNSVWREQSNGADGTIGKRSHGCIAHRHHRARQLGG